MAGKREDVLGRLGIDPHRLSFEQLAEERLWGRVLPALSSEAQREHHCFVKLILVSLDNRRWGVLWKPDARLPAALTRPTIRSTATSVWVESRQIREAQ